MFGAILGDIIGAPYEFDRGGKTKDFPLFKEDSQFTDDSVMTAAVAEALMDTPGGTDDGIRAALIKSMQKWGRRYPDANYGARFSRWLWAEEPKPYFSCGNGSAMRVSAAGWLGDTLEEVRRLARLSSEVTHDHPEGIKGAEAVASAIFLARTGRSKAEIKDFIVNEFGYDLSRTCDEIRPAYHHVETCQQTVPEALTAFFEGESFEDVIRTAVSLGGDCDTLTCIAGSVAEAFYGVPRELVKAAEERLDEALLGVERRLYGTIAKSIKAGFIGRPAAGAAEAGGPAVEIRETAAEDVKNVQRLWADGDVMRFVGFPEGTEESDESMQNWFEWVEGNRPWTNHYSIYEDGVYCGEASYDIDSESGSASLDIKLFPFARGRGIASAALKRAIEDAFANGAETVWVDPHPDNERALALYRRLGFTEKPMPEHVADLGEDPEASVYMELEKE